MSDKSHYVTLGDLAVGRKNNFDFIRFAAAMVVLFTHSFPLSGNNESEPLLMLSHKQATFANLAVAVFFVISGFLVSQSYERSRSVVAYSKARVLRIFPGLFFVLFLSAFLLGPLTTSLPRGDYFSNLETYQYLKAAFLFPLKWNLPGVFTANAYSGTVNGSLWTIPYEVLCYIFVGAWGVLGLLRGKKMSLFMFVLIYYLFFIRGTVWADGGPRLLGLAMAEIINLFVFFAAGMFVYAFRDHIPLDRYVAMISVVVLILSIFLGGLKELFVIFGSYLVFYFAFHPSVNLSKFAKYGDFSYGIYLYAFPVQQMVTSYHGGRMSEINNFLISFPIVLSLAVFSWYAVERNFLRLKKVPLLSRFIPRTYSEMFNARIAMLDDQRQLLLAYLGRLGWKSFSSVCVLLFVFVRLYTVHPSTVEFPYHRSSSIFHGGWLPQSPDEKYRWIAGSASVDLERPAEATELIIRGYVPPIFEGLNSMRVYFNGQLLREMEVKNGTEINFTSQIPRAMSSKQVNVRLDFNYIHQPAPGDLDKRKLSALINRIAIQ